MMDEGIQGAKGLGSPGLPDVTGVTRVQGVRGSQRKGLVSSFPTMLKGTILSLLSQSTIKIKRKTPDTR